MRPIIAAGAPVVNEHACMARTVDSPAALLFSNAGRFAAAPSPAPGYRSHRLLAEKGAAVPTCRSGVLAGVLAGVLQVRPARVSARIWLSCRTARRELAPWRQSRVSGSEVPRFQPKVQTIFTSRVDTNTRLILLTHSRVAMYWRAAVGSNLRIDTRLTWLDRVNGFVFSVTDR